MTGSLDTVSTLPGANRVSGTDRAPTLEEQAKDPPVNPIEMGMQDLDAAIARVKALPG